MATRSDYRSELRNRLGDNTSVAFTDAELNDYLDSAVNGLYPTFFQRKVDTTTATAGPLQTAPAGARNFHRIALKRVDSNRVRKVRDWEEGDGEAYIPKTAITDQTIVWSWTQGWEAPADDAEVYTHPTEAREVALLRAHVSALESLLSGRIKTEKYHALHVRPGITEEDVLSTLEALHASLRERYDRALPLPEVEK